MKDKESKNVIIPGFIKEAKAGDILATKYNHLLMVEHVKIEKNKVCIYYYFNYEDGKLLMNEWLTGFYGPKFDDKDFYRPATEEEKKLFLKKMEEYGYIMNDFYNKPTPTMSPKEHHRRYCSGSMQEESVNGNLEKAIDRYEDFVHGFESLNNHDCRQIARYFAKWGSDCQKQQMIKDAVEVEISDNGCAKGLQFIPVWPFTDEYVGGDKVKLILIKEE